MIQLSGAGKRFGAQALFQDLDWLVTPQDRVGLVGGNGTGKSTLLKILGGLESLDYGSVAVTRGTLCGYLPQEGLSLSGRTVFEECMSVFASLRLIEDELETLTHQMPDLDPASAEYREVGERFHRLEGEFIARDGYALESQVGAVLAGLGFPKEDWTRRTEEFSGGWQMRIALAKLLLEKPNLLLLDEPTNHLDLEARNWLEEYLEAYPFAFVIVSHDRYFLDVVTKRIIEIWNRRVHFYAGNYEQYLKLKQERLEQLENAYRNQRERIEQLEAFINRFRYKASKARQVQSKIKELDRIERVEIPPEERTIHFKFPQPKASGRIVAECSHVRKSYGDKVVFDDVGFLIERGDRVVLVGVNGAGKSTLIRILSGSEPLTAGEYRLGHNVQADYFAQDQYKVLDPDARMLDDLWSMTPMSNQTELRSLLGCFLFSEDDVFKRLGVLSGGERNRYALARLLLRPSNFLLLDEPTNHLDLRAKDMLLDALKGYTGTLVFVSHDRYFIDRLATRVFEIGEGQVRIYPGNYEDYLWKKQNPQGSFVPAPIIEISEPEPAPAVAASPSKRVNPIRLKQMKDRCGELEEEVARLEADIAGLEAELGRFTSVEETMRLSQRLDRRREELAGRVAEWEQTSKALEDAAV